MILADSIVGVLFERGGFTSSDTHFTALALIAYAVGLAAYACNKVFVPTFYALNNTRTPVRITLMAVFINVSCSVLLIVLLPFGFKYVGLALGTSISVIASSSMLAYGLRSRLGTFAGYDLGKTILKIVLLSLVMGAGVILVNHSLLRSWPDPDLLLEIGILGICVATGLLLYTVGARILAIRELGYLVPWLRRGDHE
jgi:putative peptidoglycan lipid II flippase